MLVYQYQDLNIHIPNGQQISVKMQVWIFFVYMMQFGNVKAYNIFNDPKRNPNEFQILFET